MKASFISILLILFLLISCSAREVVTFPYVAYKSLADRFVTNNLNFKSLMNLDYASMYVELGTSKSILILGYDDNSYLSWFDAEKNGLISFSGKVIGTFGLVNDYTITNPPNLSEIFSLLSNTKQPDVPITSLIQFSNPATGMLEIEFNYKLEKVYDEYEFGSFRERSFYVITEFFSIEKIKWSGVNKYYFNNKGEFMKSDQHLTPNQPPIYVSIIKKYSI